MLRLLAVDDAARATILAALAYYRAQGMGDPYIRGDDINDIATGGTIGAGLIPLGDDGILALEDQVRRADEAAAPKVGLYASVEDIDGALTVQLHDSEDFARQSIVRSLGEYDDLDESELGEALEMLESGGFCKIDRNIGHNYEIVEITDPASLQLVARAPELVRKFADAPGLEGWMVADEHTRELIPGAAYMRTLGGGNSGYVIYDMTIVRDDRQELPFIPMHGSVKMHSAPSAADAARMLMEYWADLTDNSKRAASRPYLERPRS